MKRRNEGGGRRRISAALFACLLAFCVVHAALAEKPAEQYVENQWNFVDGEMDVTHGIPEDAEGVLADIRTAGVLRVGTEPYYPPQEFIDPSREGMAQYAGADMELARLIARRMGVELEIIPMDFADIISAPAEGRCDLVISALAYTPTRAGLATLSKGYFYTMTTSGSGMVIREEDADRIVTIADLAGRDIVAQRGSLQESQMAENVRNYRQFRRVPSVQEVYQMVQDGTADAGAVDIEAAAAYIRNNPGCGLALARDIRTTLEKQFDGDRIAAKKGEYQLIYFVNGVISEVLDSGLYQQWYDESADYAARLGL